MCTLVWVNAVYTLLLSTPLVIPRLVSCMFSCVFMRLSYLLVFMFTFSFVQGLIFKSKAFYNACLNCFEVLLNHVLFVGVNVNENISIQREVYRTYFICFVLALLLNHNKTSGRQITLLGTQGSLI